MADVIMQPARSPMRRVLAIRDFFLLWMGQGTSLLGDQFHAIAGAWLVLKITGDPLALGVVLALGGISSAIFTVIGGVITDRISPRRVMLVADVVRLLFSLALAVQVFTGTLQSWMIYFYALGVGVFSGAFAPASMSIAPRIVPAEDLQAGNSVMQGSMQLIRFVGPAVAGALIAAFPQQNTGVGVALAFDAATFVASIVTLLLMQSGGEVAVADEARATDRVWTAIAGGIRFVVRDPFLRFLFVLLAVANFAFGGAIAVGIPFLADTRFPGGAAAYGLIISGYAGGNLLGIILSGSLPRLNARVIKLCMVAMFLAFSIGIGALAWINGVWFAMADLSIMGVLNGYLGILLITELQRNTPREMLGRLMSLILLASMGLTPLAQAISGAVLRWNVPCLFLGAAGLLFICMIFLALPGVSKLLGEHLAEPAADIA